MISVTEVLITLNTFEIFKIKKIIKKNIYKCFIIIIKEKCR